MLTSLALIFLCGLLLGSIVQKLKVPSLIGMLLTGILLGPDVLNVLDSSILSLSSDLRELALIIILTRAGLSLDLEDLKKIGGPAILMSFLPAFFEMTATIFLANQLFHLPLLDCAILASILASASPAVIVPRMLKLMETGYGIDKNIPQLILAGDSIDDILNIVIFTSLIGLKTGDNISLIKFAQIPISILLGILVGIAIGYILVKVFKKFHMRDSVKVVLLLSIAFLFVGIEEMMARFFPLSGLLSVMTAGVVMLKMSPLVAKRISSKCSKLWVGAEVLLFVLVGASVNISYASSAGLKVILMLIIVIAVRAIGILVCLIKTNLNWKEKLFCTFSGIPKATVQAAIGGIPLSMGLANGEFMLAVAVVAILITAPVGAMILDSTDKKLLSKTKVID